MKEAYRRTAELIGNVLAKVVRFGYRAIARAARIAAVPVCLGIAALLGLIFVGLVSAALGNQRVVGSLESLGQFLGADIQASALKRALSLGIATFGGGVILATLKDLVETLPRLWTFIKHETADFRDLLEPGATVFVSFTGLFMSLQAIQGVPDKSQASVLALTVDQHVHLGTVHETGPLATFYILFGKEGGKDSLHPSHPSVAVDPIYSSFLKQLATSLQSCAKDGPTEVRIAGFSSSSAWDEAENSCVAATIAEGRANKPGDAFNICLAEARAHRVLTALGLPEWASNVKWKDHSEMEREMRFHDRSAEGGFDPPRGFLTRHAQIRILKAGKCVRSRIESIG